MILVSKFMVHRALSDITYLLLGLLSPLKRNNSKGAGEINMGVCPHLDFDNIMLFNCLGYNFNIYGAFEF